MASCTPDTVRWLSCSASFLVKSSIPEVCLVTGTSKVCKAVPIIGPPLIILAGSSVQPPQNSITSRKEVPSLTSNFWVLLLPLLIQSQYVDKEDPVCMARAMAAAVHTLLTSTPISAGSPSRNLTSGYSIYQLFFCSLRIPGWKGYYLNTLFFCAASFIIFIASGLLSS